MQKGPGRSGLGRCACTRRPDLVVCSDATMGLEVPTHSSTSFTVIRGDRTDGVVHHVPHLFDFSIKTCG